MAVARKKNTEGIIVSLKDCSEVNIGVYNRRNNIDDQTDDYNLTRRHKVNIALPFL
jgi:hypothetical protein